MIGGMIGVYPEVPKDYRGRAHNADWKNKSFRKKTSIELSAEGNHLHQEGRRGTFQKEGIAYTNASQCEMLWCVKRTTSNFVL